MSTTATRKAAQKRVLYVEDDDANWAVACGALESHYDIVRAADDREALRVLRDNSFDIILMDIELRGSELDGLRLTRLLKGEDGLKPPSLEGVDLKHVPVIFLTAYASRYSRDDLLEAGGDDLVTKPIDFARLSLAMSRLLLRQAFKRNQRISKLVEPQRPMGEERRAHLRARMEIECRLKAGPDSFEATTSNISPGGLKLSIKGDDLPSRLPIGSIFTVQLEPIWGGLEAECEIIRLCSDQPYIVGASFLNLSKNEQLLLDRWLFGTDG